MSGVGAVTPVWGCKSRSLAKVVEAIVGRHTAHHARRRLGGQAARTMAAWHGGRQGHRGARLAARNCGHSGTEMFKLSGILTLR